MKEADNILRIFIETRQALNEGNSFKIKQLSNQTTHSATISQDPDNIIVAVLVYAISKIIERENYKNLEGWDEFYYNLLKNWDSAIKSLEKKDIEEFRTILGKIRNSINRIGGNMKEYIQDIFLKSQINKAFKIYEHGLSAETTAELLGVSLWDLASYIGQSSISEGNLNQGIPVEKRIKTAEEFFA